MRELVVSRHPLVADLLARLRDRGTRPADFRDLVRRLATLLGVEATADLPLDAVEVETPLTRCAAARVQTRVGLVPILRAGLGMVDGLLDLLPDAEVWHLGLYRDEESLQPVEYYNKLDPARPVRRALVLDPMLATGGSAAAAIAVLRHWGVEEIRFLGILGAPEGVEALHAADPGVRIHLGALDERLDERGYILPGLGDAGDRQFGTLAPEPA
jgi:uracil phosphoribosyltransferase